MSLYNHFNSEIDPLCTKIYFGSHFVLGKGFNPRPVILTDPLMVIFIRKPISDALAAYIRHIKSKAELSVKGEEFAHFALMNTDLVIPLFGFR